jgi:hypothetical protein
VADVCRADESVVEVYAFDLAIGSQHLEAVPLGLDDGGVIANADNHERWGRRNSQTYALNERALSDICDCLSQSPNPQSPIPAILRIQPHAFPESR